MLTSTMGHRMRSGCTPERTDAGIYTTEEGDTNE